MSGKINRNIEKLNALLFIKGVIYLYFLVKLLVKKSLGNRGLYIPEKVYLCLN